MSATAPGVIRGPSATVGGPSVQELEPYPAYKESGLEWLGPIPVEWHVRRAKTLFQSVDKRSTTGGEELLTVSSDRGVVPRASASVTMFKAESYVGHKLCWPGDLVINSLWAWGRGLGVSSRHGIVSTAYGVYRVRPGARVLPAYIHALVRSVPFNWELRVRSKGIWVSRLQLTDRAFLAAPIPVPPLEDQLSIVAFLDRQTSKINGLVEQKRKLVGLLREMRTALVSHAVTKGLDPKAPMKDSGVKWLGEIPAHWEVRRLKTIAENVVAQAAGDSAVPVHSGNPLYVAMEHVESWTGKIDSEGASRSLSPGQQVKRFGPTDVLFGKLRPYLAKVARPGCHGVCVTEFLVLRPRSSSFTTGYLAHVLRTKPVIGVVDSSTFGARMPRSDWRFIGGLQVTLPPTQEQRAIADHLDRLTSKIDALVAKITESIDLLHEYRTALVAATVTGQIDVRGRSAACLEGREPMDARTVG